MNLPTSSAKTLISIHAPREGGDFYVEVHGGHIGISIHAPREGGDAIYSGSPRMADLFQSTPPARGATSPRRVHLPGHLAFQSTPPARGATIIYNHPQQSRNISIHAPREGGDENPLPNSRRTRHFNPRPPRGGRLAKHLSRGRGCVISIHAPREGGDPHVSGDRATFRHFNPRPPRGGRRLPGAAQHVGQSISIHAPREGGDFPQ